MIAAGLFLGRTECQHRPMTSTLIRCALANSDPLTAQHPDTEWGVPVRIASARIGNAMQGAGEDFATLRWSFTSGKTIRSHGKSTQTPLSQTISSAPKRHGCKMIGPPLVHPWMQAVCSVGDQAPACALRLGA